MKEENDVGDWMKHEGLKKKNVSQCIFWKEVCSKKIRREHMSGVDRKKS